MSDNEDLSKTMLIPNPGGRRSQKLTAPISQSSALDTDKTQIHSESVRSLEQRNIAMGKKMGENRLLVHATDIINLAANISTLEPSSSIEQLRMDVERLFDSFGQQLSQEGVANEVALTARYLLCCLLDELILNTPWGDSGVWGQHTLLSKYHNETSGGEKFFLIADKVVESAATNIDLVEVCYVCISVGFRGKYRISQDGEQEILHISNKLYQPIALYRPEPRELSPSWQISKADLSIIKAGVSPTLLVTLLIFLAIAVYVLFLSNLNTQSAPLLSKSESIAWDNLLTEPSANQSPKLQTDEIINDLRFTLREPISKKQLKLGKSNGMAVISLISPALFPSGSTKVNQTVMPNPQSLVDAIRPYADSVIIVGHTDSTGLAESNWAISRQRAEAVQDWLNLAQPKINQSVTRGVADTQPIVNAVSASQNRRVEIILLPKDAL